MRRRDDYDEEIREHIEVKTRENMRAECLRQTLGKGRRTRLR